MNEEEEFNKLRDDQNSWALRREFSIKESSSASYAIIDFRILVREPRISEDTDFGGP